MSTYARPPIATPVCRDADGQIIDYGRRWDGSPPEDTYSVDAHPERFAPLHAVVDALIAHLEAAFDVEVAEGDELAADLLHRCTDVVRAVRVRPNDPACAPLTFVYTGYPGIALHAGLVHDFSYPVCGCDACDSTWEAEADELERYVHGVVTGHYREDVERGFRPWLGHAITYPGGSASSRSRARDLPADRVRAAVPVLRKLPDGWRAWPPAPTSVG